MITMTIIHLTVSFFSRRSHLAALLVRLQRFRRLNSAPWADRRVTHWRRFRCSALVLRADLRHSLFLRRVCRAGCARCALGPPVFAASLDGASPTSPARRHWHASPA